MASADRLKPGPWGCAAAERNIRSSDLGDHHEHVVSGDDTRGDEVVVDLDKQRLLELVLAVLEGGDLRDPQLLRLRHAEVATGLTEVLGVVLVEQLMAVVIRRVERADDRRLNR